VAGIAVGTSSAGWVVDHWSSRAGFLLAAAAGLVALALGLGGRRAREPQDDAVAAGERMEA
jgi:predicted MFS family arabinose efflux permease